MTQVDDYKYPWKDKDATTVNDSTYTFLIHGMMMKAIGVNMMRQVKSQSKILTFMTHQLEPLLWSQSSPESESLDEGDLGLLSGAASPTALLTGGGV